jgi:hypothetical protein
MNSRRHGCAHRIESKTDTLGQNNECNDGETDHYANNERQHEKKLFLVSTDAPKEFV